MEILTVSTLLSLKSHPDVQNLDDEKIKILMSLFGNHILKKKIKKSSNHILKNHKMQNQKDTIENKINLILNKLSETNIDSLLFEFIDNINQVTEEEFEEIQKTFYSKIVSEINFIKIYLHFLKYIGFLYNKVQNFNLKYFIDLVYNNFINISDEESKRVNNLTLIKNLVDYEIISENVLIECDNILLLREKYYTDIYYWFNMRNKELSLEQIDKIKLILNKNISNREKVLLENLINNKLTTQNVEDGFVNITKNTLQLEVDNIIDEYLLLKSLDDMKSFIETRCADSITKNKFSECLIDKYFIENKNNMNEIVELIKLLLKNQILFKANVIKGLTLLYSDWNNKVIDYTKGNEKMKNLLGVFKSLNMTKGIENILDNYKL
jgi:hypothetical protein